MRHAGISTTVTRRTSMAFWSVFALSCTLLVSRHAEAATKLNEGPKVAVSFELEVQPILTAKGCNQGACHGKQRGQNGFQLSLLGFDSDFDFAAISRESRGRRVSLVAPEHSLLLKKATGEMPHGGGVKIEYGSADYQTLLAWIEQGMPRRRAGEPTIEGIELSAEELRLAPGETNQLAVTVIYSDGSRIDGTSRSAFQSNDAPIASVSAGGEVSAGQLPGETAIMVRYQQEIAVCRVVIPRIEALPTSIYESLSRESSIDALVWDKLARLNVQPSAPADDEKFLRRVFVDIIGRLPTADEARAFLEDGSKAKRERLVDQLLDSPEYAEHWANKWVDLLRPNPYRVGIKAVLNYDQWIRQQFRDNRPYNEFVYELLTAQGSTFDASPVTFYRDRRSPDERATMVSQLFLGIRLECAKCHHHPFERWAQEDFYSFAAFFGDVGRKGTGLSPPISGSEEMFFDGTTTSVKHPTSGEVMSPQVLYGENPFDGVSEAPSLRRQLASWLTAEDNPYFARVQVNRIWSDLMGRGLVEPVDDMRATNPASNEPLLEELAQQFRDSGFDQKRLIKQIVLSQVYSLSSQPNPTNEVDYQNYSRRYRRRLRAEVLLDSMESLTGQPQQWTGVPPGSMAKEIWTHRVRSTFLDTFGRPNPNQDPPCERVETLTMTQTLHLMNSPEIFKLVGADSGKAATLAKNSLDDSQIVEELYLSLFARFPSPAEKQIGQRYLAEFKDDRKASIEDLMWALMNSPEFIFLD